MDLIIMLSIPALTLLISVLVILGRKSQKFVDGGVYTIKNSKGQFGMIKILQVDKDFINCLIYTKIFHFRPQTVQLSAMAERPKYIKVKKKSLTSWEPMMIGKVKLKPREITRYLSASKAS